MVQIEPDHDINPATIFVPPHNSVDPEIPIVIPQVETKKYIPPYIDKEALDQSEKEDTLRLEHRRRHAARIVTFAGFEALALGITLVLVCILGLGAIPAAWYFAVVLVAGIIVMYAAISLFRYRYWAYRVVRVALFLAAGGGFFSLLPSGINASAIGIALGLSMIFLTTPVYCALLDEDVKALF